MVPTVSVPVAAAPPAEAERKTIIVPVAIPPPTPNIARYVKPTAVAPATGPIAVVATTSVDARPHVVTPPLIVAIEIAAAEFSTSAIAINKAQFVAANCIIQPTSQVALIGLLTFAPKGLVTLAHTTVAAVHVAGAKIA
jgi:hypothetical protein